jgi:hypothetical protein
MNNRVEHLRRISRMDLPEDTLVYVETQVESLVTNSNIAEAKEKAKSAITKCHNNRRRRANLTFDDQKKAIEEQYRKRLASADFQTREALEIQKLYELKDAKEEHEKRRRSLLKEKDELLRLMMERIAEEDESFRLENCTTAASERDDTDARAKSTKKRPRECDPQPPNTEGNGSNTSGR